MCWLLGGLLLMWTSRCHLGWREICHLEGFLLGCLEERKVKTQKPAGKRRLYRKGVTKFPSLFDLYTVYLVFCSSFWLEKIALQLQNNENVVWFFVIKRWEFVDICTPWAVKERQRWFGRLTSHPNGYFGERETCFLLQKISPKSCKTKNPEEKKQNNFLEQHLHVSSQTLKHSRGKRQRTVSRKRNLILKKQPQDGAILSLFVCLFSWKMAISGFSVVSTWGLKSSQHPRCL